MHATCAACIPSCAQVLFRLVDQEIQPLVCLCGLRTGCWRHAGPPGFISGNSLMMRACP